MKNVSLTDFQPLYLPPVDSHKGQNGRLLIIGGSHLFHSAALWALTVASRVVDLVHFASVPENNEIVAKAKEEFRNGIVISRDHIEDYITEDNCILIGPGMVRDAETKLLTDTLLKKYPQKQWVIDAGALQMVNPEIIPHNAILTPHHGEFEMLWNSIKNSALVSQLPAYPEENDVQSINRLIDCAKVLHCVIVLKGEEDIVCTDQDSYQIQGGNSGMTKGGDGRCISRFNCSVGNKKRSVALYSSGKLYQ